MGSGLEGRSNSDPEDRFPRVEAHIRLEAGIRRWIKLVPIACLCHTWLDTSKTYFFTSRSILDRK